LDLNDCMKIAASPFCQHYVSYGSDLSDSSVDSWFIRHPHHQEMFRACWQNSMVDRVFSMNNSGYMDNRLFSHHVVSSRNVHKRSLMNHFHGINVTFKHDIGVRNLYSV